MTFICVRFDWMWLSPHVTECGIQQIFGFGIRNPLAWNPKSNCLLESGILYFLWNCRILNPSISWPPRFYNHNCNSDNLYMTSQKQQIFYPKMSLAQNAKYQKWNKTRDIGLESGIQEDKVVGIRNPDGGNPASKTSVDSVTLGEGWIVLHSCAASIVVIIHWSPFVLPQHPVSSLSVARSPTRKDKPF